MSKGKFLVEAYKSYDTSKVYNFNDAVDIILKNKRSKINETIEISLNLGVDPRHADQMVRGTVNLPNGSGKKIKVAVFATIFFFPRNFRVLVIDDDKDVRELLSRLLKDAGYRPIDARDGKEGLERTKDEPSLIILDLEMPRMDGFEFLDNYIKDVPEDKRAPVLVFSGKDLTDVQEDLLNERVIGLVKKDDVSMDNLSKMIQGIIKD